MDIGDGYDELQEFGDTLWDICQSPDVDASDAAKAQSMYDTLENVYLEPIRRLIYQADSAKLADATKQLNNTTAGIAQTIKAIQNIIQTTKDLDQYAKLFDSVIGVAASMLKVLAV